MICISILPGKTTAKATGVGKMKEKEKEGEKTNQEKSMQLYL